MAKLANVRLARDTSAVGNGKQRKGRRAQASGLLAGRPVELAQQFAGLLWRDLMVSLLLGVVERPSPREITVRARDAAAAFLQLHRQPNQAPAA